MVAFFRTLALNKLITVRVQYEYLHNADDDVVVNVVVVVDDNVDDDNDDDQ